VLCIGINIPKLPNEAAGEENLIATRFSLPWAALFCGVISRQIQIQTWYRGTFLRPAASLYNSASQVKMANYKYYKYIHFINIYFSQHNYIIKA